MYDDYGREIGWVDYTNHGYGNINSPDYHTALIGTKEYTIHRIGME